MFACYANRKAKRRIILFKVTLKSRHARLYRAYVVTGNHSVSKHRRYVTLIPRFPVVVVKLLRVTKTMQVERCESQPIYPTVKNVVTPCATCTTACNVVLSPVSQESIEFRKCFETGTRRRRTGHIKLGNKRSIEPVEEEPSSSSQDNNV